MEGRPNMKSKRKKRVLGDVFKDPRTQDVECKATQRKARTSQIKDQILNYKTNQNYIVLVRKKVGIFHYFPVFLHRQIRRRGFWAMLKRLPINIDKLGHMQIKDTSKIRSICHKLFFPHGSLGGEVSFRRRRGKEVDLFQQN